jgi:hypothetical protein
MLRYMFIAVLISVTMIPFIIDFADALDDCPCTQVMIRDPEDDYTYDKCLEAKTFPTY